MVNVIVAFLVGGLMFSFALVGWLYKCNPGLKWKV